VVLFTGSSLGWMLVNALNRHFGPVTVLREEPESKGEIVRRRAKILGWPNAIGQAVFGVFSRVLSRLAQDRRKEIIAAAKLDPELDPALPVTDIGSVNSETCRELLRKHDPRVVVVYGTRLLRRPTLEAVTAPFINYHAGINPKYRGQSGAYWALCAGDKENAGLTIHLVDTGVDTGDVLYQKTSTFTPRDNFTTYQIVQMGEAAPLMIRAVEDALAGDLKPYKRTDLASQQFFMPTIWFYLRTALTKNVW